MHAQQAHRDAEQQQLQLSEMLRSALAQLGAALTPNKSVSGARPGRPPARGGCCSPAVAPWPQPLWGQPPETRP
jgi:hypothetical protein